MNDSTPIQRSAGAPLQPGYVILPQEPAPPDYPFEPNVDAFSSQSFDSDYQKRRQAYLEFILRNPAPESPKAVFYELARLAAGGTPHLGLIQGGLNYIDSRQDCADFTLHSLLRLLYQFSGHVSFEPALLERARQTILDFRYWPDEPGEDGMCTWTENHYILFASAAFLAGQLYPENTFTNSGLSGVIMSAIHRERILRWLELRFLTGFSEWLSNVYYDEDLTALLSLVDFSMDEEISRRAALVLDLILLDMALNSHKGVFGSTHGRSYENAKKWAEQEDTSDTMKLLFGLGSFTGIENMSAACLALSPNYHLPRVLYDIANDQRRTEMVNRQRMGIRLSQAGWWGLKTRDFEDGMLLLNQEAYLHPRTARLFLRMMDAFRWWDNPFFAPIRKRRWLVQLLRYSGLLSLVARRCEKDLGRNTREEVNIYTCRTPEYLLSSAQDYRKGYGGDQQHIWQATLGAGAVCFTTQPARLQGPPPNNWTGSGVLPRVAQIKNVVIAIYRIRKFPSLFVRNELFYSHAWFPRDQFDEFYEKEGWVFSRLGEGYLALLSQHPYEWREMPGEDQHREMIVKKRDNIWLCECGRKESDGDFQTFMERILQAEVQFYPSRVSYYSPSLGRIQFGWKGPLRLDGQEITMNDYPRYGNPYTQAEFPSESIQVSLGEQTLTLDWAKGRREASQFLS
ncbi:MAG: hypothetical protein JXB15_14835 [Anaerolineales bacterium]|nr:hypothetical protein [Anaerolineales bacterium]